MDPGSMDKEFASSPFDAVAATLNSSQVREYSDVRHTIDIGLRQRVNDFTKKAIEGLPCTYLFLRNSQWQRKATQYSIDTNLEYIIFSARNSRVMAIQEACPLASVVHISFLTDISSNRSFLKGLSDELSEDERQRLVVIIYHVSSDELLKLCLLLESPEAREEFVASMRILCIYAQSVRKGPRIVLNDMDFDESFVLRPGAAGLSRRNSDASANNSENGKVAEEGVFSNNVAEFLSAAQASRSASRAESREPSGDADGTSSAEAAAPGAKNLAEVSQEEAELLKTAALFKNQAANQDFEALARDNASKPAELGEIANSNDITTTGDEEAGHFVVVV